MGRTRIARYVSSLKLSRGWKSLPHYHVKHAGGQSATPLQTTATGMQVIVSGNMYGVAAGNYLADRYQVTNTFIDIFDPGQEVIGHWPRYSSSVGVSADMPISGQTEFIYTATINQNVASVTTTAYCWYVTVNLGSGQTGLNTWIPAQPSQRKSAYSLYVRDNVNTGLEERSETGNLNLYPNPTTGQLSLEFTLTDPSNALLQVFDATGRKVADLDMGKQKAGQQIININLTHLRNGAYICKLVLDERVITKRIIKN